MIKDQERRLADLEALLDSQKRQLTKRVNLNTTYLFFILHFLRCFIPPTNEIGGAILETVGQFVKCFVSTPPTVFKSYLNETCYT